MIERLIWNKCWKVIQFKVTTIKFCCGHGRQRAAHAMKSQSRSASLLRLPSSLFTLQSTYSFVSVKTGWRLIVNCYCYSHSSSQANANAMVLSVAFIWFWEHQRFQIWIAWSEGRLLCMGFQFQANKMLVKFRLARCCRRTQTQRIQQGPCPLWHGCRAKEIFGYGASTSCAFPLYLLALARFVHSLHSLLFIFSLQFGTTACCVPLTGAGGHCW